mmetsp:Transcript_2203/g.5154  ORF Transcript_2203/g.5154 Transcript_2203/m.5154 type:complete len:89 (-) Transcript_2203:452-718(-)
MTTLLLYQYAFDAAQFSLFVLLPVNVNTNTACHKPTSMMLGTAKSLVEIVVTTFRFPAPPLTIVVDITTSYLVEEQRLKPDGNDDTRW